MYLIEIGGTSQGFEQTPHVKELQQINIQIQTLETFQLFKQKPFRLKMIAQFLISSLRYNLTIHFTWESLAIST